MIWTSSFFPLFVQDYITVCDILMQMKVRMGIILFHNNKRVSNWAKITDQDPNALDKSLKKCRMQWQCQLLTDWWSQMPASTRCSKGLRGLTITNSTYHCLIFISVCYKNTSKLKLKCSFARVFSLTPFYEIKNL